MDKDLLEKVYATYAATGAPDKSGTILYALGQTQHHYGAQNCRAMSILQLLLGNAGMPGGGVNAMRGEPNVQGATDMGMMVHEHPAYLKWPTEYGTPTLRDWCEKENLRRRLLHQQAEVPGVLAQGMVGRPRPRSRTTTATTGGRRSPRARTTPS